MRPARAGARLGGVDAAVNGPRPAAVLAAVAVGGVVGAEARYGVSLAWPHAGGAFPWATLVTNVSGCLLIGVLMTVVGRRPVHPLTRPLLGVGVLGGYTTFSTYTVDVLVTAPGPALLYLVATPLLAFPAVALGVLATRRVLR